VGLERKMRRIDVPEEVEDLINSESLLVNNSKEIMK